MQDKRGAHRPRRTVLVASLAAVAAAASVFALDPALPQGDAWVAPLVFAALHGLAGRYPLPVPARGASAQLCATILFGFAVLLTAPAAIAIALLALTALVPARSAARSDHLLATFDVVRTVLVYSSAAVAIALLSELPTRLAQTAGASAASWELLVVVLPAGVLAHLVDQLLAVVIRSATVGQGPREAFGHVRSAGDPLVALLLVALSPALVLLAGYSLLLAPLALLLVILMHRSSRITAVQRHAALHDGLTGLANRRHLDEHLASLMRVDHRLEPFALLVMDLDRFKEVNDRLGHRIGDRLLTQVGERIGATDQIHLAARIGSDEFALVVRAPLDHDALLELGRELVQAVSEPYTVDGVRLSVGAHVGIAQYPYHATDAAMLLRRADTAMYAVKRSGDAVGFAKVDERPVAGAVTLVGRLEEAIRRAELQLNYQPQVALADGAVMGFEALLRWNHPQHGLIAPAEFVPTVEHTDLIGVLTRHVLRLAMKDAAMWLQAGHDVPVSVNISTRDLLDRHLTRDIAGLLWECGVAPSKLVLEITETALQVDPALSDQVLADLRQLGVRLSVDDFGTGYSSLAALQSLPVDELKIDRTFVMRMHEPSGLAIVRSMIQLGHALGLAVVAEGVEDEETIRVLDAQGCDHVQGYFVSRPLLPTWVVPWLRSHAERPPGGVRQRLREVPPRTAGPRLAADA